MAASPVRRHLFAQWVMERITSALDVTEAPVQQGSFTTLACICPDSDLRTDRTLTAWPSRRGRYRAPPSSSISNQPTSLSSGCSKGRDASGPSLHPPLGVRHRIVRQFTAASQLETEANPRCHPIRHGNPLSRPRRCRRALQPFAFTLTPPFPDHTIAGPPPFRPATPSRHPVVHPWFRRYTNAP